MLVKPGLRDFLVQFKNPVVVTPIVGLSPRGMLTIKKRIYQNQMHI
jgi:hypothetical protein